MDILDRDLVSQDDGIIIDRSARPLQFSPRSPTTGEDEGSETMTIQLSRRHLLRATAATGAATALPRFMTTAARADAAALNVFAPLPPDPSPPGAAKFSEDAFAKWQAEKGAQVKYELLAWQ
jgi:hypothetical protein